MNKTYCNPMPLPDIPRGMDHKLSAIQTVYGDDYCSISDPDGFFYDGQWYIFTSYGGAYTSKNLIDWEKHKMLGLEGRDYFYGPTVVQHRGKFYYTAHSLGLFVADAPFGPYKEAGDFKDMDGNKFKLLDPSFFKDDDGEIYLNWCTFIEGDTMGIMCARLEPDDLSQFASEAKVLLTFDDSHKWERWGEYNQDANFGWIEGSGMIKLGGRYYLMYAANGTTFSGYASGVYYSDESPLGEFKYQNHNPVVGKKTGHLRGGGHGCMIKNDKNEVWAFYTCRVAYHHLFERVIGMDRVFVKNGELYCEVSDIPHELDGSARMDMLPLTVHSISKASSCAAGRDAVYAVDESTLSFWQPAEDDLEPEIEVSLRGNYIAKAFRLVRRNLGLDYENGLKANPLDYKIMIKNLDGEWVTAYDNWNNAETKLVDYAEFGSIIGTDAKLVIKNPKGKVRECIVSFTVFGEKYIGQNKT